MKNLILLSLLLFMAIPTTAQQKAARADYSYLESFAVPKAAEIQATSVWGQKTPGEEQARHEVEMVVGKIRPEDVNGFEIALEHVQDTELDPALVKVAADILQTPCPKAVLGHSLTIEERKCLQPDIANGLVILT